VNVREVTIEIENLQLLFGLVTQTEIEVKIDIHMIFGILNGNQEDKRNQEKISKT
jgi:hypothetical protein